MFSLCVRELLSEEGLELVVVVVVVVVTLSAGAFHSVISGHASVMSCLWELATLASRNQRGGWVVGPSRDMRRTKPGTHVCLRTKIWRRTHFYQVPTNRLTERKAPLLPR